MNPLTREQILVGEGPPGAELDDAERRDLEASNAAILEALPPAMVAAEIDRRIRALEARRRRRRTWTLVAGCAATAALVLALWPGRGDGARHARVDSPGDVRVKGDPRLAIYRKVGAGAERLAPGQAVTPGDVVQLSYVAAGARHGVIASIDGRDVVTAHFPERRGGSTALARGGAIALEHAYRLDDAPGFERFFLITSAAPIDAAAVLAGLERWAATPGVRADVDDPPIAAPLRLRSVLLRKADDR